MISVLTKQLDKLQASGIHLLLQEASHGIEKEGLRVSRAGRLSQKPHPAGLGSALTNGNITTDFSESLLELITPVFQDPGPALQFLADLHRFTYSQLEGELIWAGSMPCHIPDPSRVPIARYGSSHIGQLKHIYRLGLAHRYGTMMQCIAGIHYNFSLSDTFWQSFKIYQKKKQSLEAFRSASYFKMIRNFRRHSWLLLFLFGSSPALCASFLKDRSHNLQRLHDQTLYLPYATSLRMSDLGYSNKVQSSQSICFNHLHTYIDSLVQATRTPYPPYEKIGVKVNGEYRQLSDTILQIENEHYSDIRPKRVAMPGERSLQALKERGVEYIEVRNTDVNPFLPVGIDLQQALFLDTFLISCLLMDDHVICPKECRMVNDNMQKVITSGREPGLLLNTPKGQRPMTEIGHGLLDEMLITGKLLDEVHATEHYSRSVNIQRGKLKDAALTPSARVLKELQETGLNYSQWVLLKSQAHKESLGLLSPETGVYTDLARRAADSREKQRQLESNRAQSFDQFLSGYLSFTAGDSPAGLKTAHH